MRSYWLKQAAAARRAVRWPAVAAVLALWSPTPSWSLPAFARQTGLACAMCHTLAFGPALTAYGRNFKLHAYAWGTQKTIPLSADLIESFTHTSHNEPPVPNYSSNNNVALDQVDGYFAGRIAEDFGAFAQVTYDRIFRHTSWGVFDTRYARDFTFGGTDTLLGVSVNNQPTVQDPWNSTYAWQFPFPSAAFANTPTPGGPQIKGALDYQVLGTTLYTLIANTVYLEAGGYRKLSDRAQGDLGIPDAANEHSLDGTAPYWRAALQKTSGPHYASVGILGFAAQEQSPQERSVGTDNYTDLGYDATYQFANGGPHTFNAYASYVQERQRLFATTALDGSDTIANHLNQVNLSGQYAYKQTYSFTLAYFDTVGNTNHALYAPGALFGSANGTPDNSGYIMQLECVPFGKFGSFARPWVNVRFGLQYTAYTRFNGGTTNYDGFGNSAHDNNTLFLFVWTAI
jgi:hypothetical protein